MKFTVGLASPCILLLALSSSVAVAAKHFPRDFDSPSKYNIGKDWEVFITELTRAVDGAVVQEYQANGIEGPNTFAGLIDSIFDIPADAEPAPSVSTAPVQGAITIQDGFPFPGLKGENGDVIQGTLNQTILKLDIALSKAAVGPADIGHKIEGLTNALNDTYGKLDNSRTIRELMGCLTAGADDVLGDVYTNLKNGGVTMDTVLTNLTETVSQSVGQTISTLMNELRSGPLAEAVQDVEAAFRHAFEAIQDTTDYAAKDKPSVLEQLIVDLAKPASLLAANGERTLKELVPRIADGSLKLESSLGTLADDTQHAVDQLVNHADTTSVILSLASFRLVESMHTAIERVLGQYVNFIRAAQSVIHAVYITAEFAIKSEQRIHKWISFILNNPIGKLIGRLRIFKGLLPNIAHAIGNAIISIIIHPTTPGGEAFRNLIEAIVDILRNLIIFIQGEHNVLDLAVVQPSILAAMDALETNYPELKSVVGLVKELATKFVFNLLLKDPLILDTLRHPTEENIEKAIKAIIYAFKKTFL